MTLKIYGCICGQLVPERFYGLKTADPERLCLFKTTMLIEAHWKVIKRGFLPRFFRPRLDLVIYVIITRLLPYHQRRCYQVTSGRETVAWRKDFKKEWKGLLKRARHRVYIHITDVTSCTCSCRAFLQSRWPICYHLIFAAPDVRSNINLFVSVVRQKVYPFLKHPSLQPEDNIILEDSSIECKHFYLFN